MLIRVVSGPFGCVGHQVIGYDAAPVVGATRAALADDAGPLGRMNGCWYLGDAGGAAGGWAGGTSGGLISDLCVTHHMKFHIPYV